MVSRLGLLLFCVVNHWVENLYNTRPRLISEPTFILEQTFKQYSFQYLDFLKEKG